MLWIQKYFIRIRIRRSVNLIYGSGSRRPINYGSGRVKILLEHFVAAEITIYAPMIYTAPCVMFLMRADTLCMEEGGGEAK